MSHYDVPSFEEWANYCFTDGYADFEGAPSGESRYDRAVEIDAVTVTRYLTRLFESPAWIAEAYSDDQIAAGTWFIFGVASSYLGEVRRGAVAPAEQARCIASVATLYTELFDRVCGNRGADPEEPLHLSQKVDIAVYMIWDMDNIEGALLFPDESPHLVEPALDVLSTVMRRCVTSACLVSALHGLGHAYGFHQSNGNAAVAARVRGMVDEFLGRRVSAPEWLSAYAEAARDGNVQ